MPMTQPLPRKILPVPKPRRRVQNGKGNSRAASSSKVAKAGLSMAQEQRSGLTPEEMDRAQALANITNNYQRPDKDLIEAMEKRGRRQPTITNTNTSSATAKHGSPTAPDHLPAFPPNPAAPCMAPTRNRARNRGGDWEDRARRLIERNDLSLDRDWSRLSWKQKANNIARLKLLKDDGYDIQPLLCKGVTSDHIIDAIFAHGKTRTRRQAQGSRSNTGYNRAASEGSSKSVSELPGDKDGNRISQSCSSSLQLGITRPEELGCIAPPEESRVYPTTPLIPQKRKHTHEDDYDCTCGFSPRKLARILAPREVAREIHEQAYTMLKWRICRVIFRAARLERRGWRVESSTGTAEDDGGGGEVEAEKTLSVPKSRCVPCAEAKTARLVFVEVAGVRHWGAGRDKDDEDGVGDEHADEDQSENGKEEKGNSGEESGVETGKDEDKASAMNLTSTAFDLITRELKCLSYWFDADTTTYHIHDHDHDHDASNSHHELFDSKYDIRLSCDTQHRHTTVLEGESTALISLLKYLRSHELFHLGRYSVGDVHADEDGVRDVQMKIARNERVSGHLSCAAERVLERVERVLEEGKEDVKVKVAVVRQEVKSRVT
ncbi:hypothetical protein ACJQWK_08909 [Exserohilum turcicum]|uniref:Uncharacterized protein n=1 Tax=Exserohilum turcicum (strain 28A) TaxID=671987 RepID=R0KFE3_EXST2|nr:uncharacterized protein SETTUDRAFT_31143 [Exserohilum turcica Et28A]EOA86827.1 hypothetical protein SETTUDRAFT_31143 [Exserohilum turcica Et28A]